MDSKIKDIMLHAYRETEYYHTLINENNLNIDEYSSTKDLQHIPCLTKIALQKNEDNFLSKRYYTFPWNKTIQVKRVVDSAGYLMKFYWDSNDNNKSLSYLQDIRHKRYGITPTMRVCSFYGTRYVGNKLVPHESQVIDYNRQHLAFSYFNLTDEKIKKIITEIDAFSPVWLSLRPSIALLFADTIKRLQLAVPRSLRYIELSGEFLSEAHRSYLQDVFRNVTITYLYSMDETNAIAFECSHKSLHVLCENVFVEIIKEGKSVTEEIGNVQITSLTNYAMPLIRYATEDIGILTNKKCLCGERTPVIEILESHPCKFYVTKNKNKISNCVMESIIEYTNESMLRTISRFSLEQVEPDTFNIELYLKPTYIKWKNSIKQEFLDNVIESRLLQSKWNFAFKKAFL